MKRANEKPIEAKLRKGVTRLGGLCLKLPAVYFTGIPDRLCLLPGGRVYFVETKSSGKDLSPRQLYVKNLLEGLGFEVFKMDSEAALAEFLKGVEAVTIFEPPTSSKSYLNDLASWNPKPGGPRFLVSLPGEKVTVVPYRLYDVEPLTPSEEKELAELQKARDEIKARDFTDDLSIEDWERLRDLRYRLNY